MSQRAEENRGSASRQAEYFFTFDKTRLPFLRL
jgi:hypothetical protein